jgi:hypothetical protein
MKLFASLTLSITMLSSVAWSAPATDAQTQVVKLFQSNEERTAKDAIWTSARIFKVGVINTTQNRDGYANYVCEVLYDYGFKGQKIWVQVVDIVELSKNGKWVKLGEAHCL